MTFINKRPLFISITQYLILFLSSIAIFYAFAPLYPFFPAAGLDESWRFAMNEAVARGLVIGKDLIFTFGPYASVYTNSYNPATVYLMWGGSILLSINYITTLYLLSSKENLLGQFLYLVFIILCVMYADTLFFSYPLFLGLVIYRITLPHDHPYKLNLSKTKYAALIVSFISLGLLPLIKGTMLILCSATIITSFILLWYKKEKFLAISLIVVPVFSIMALWVIAGQPLINLYDYFVGISKIAAGYSEAMAYSDSGELIVIYCLATLLILYSILSQKTLPLIQKLFLFFIFSLYLFISFKAGFVRQDGHASISGGAILLAAVSINFVHIINYRLLICILLLSGTTFSAIHYTYFNVSLFAIMRTNITNTYLHSWKEIRNWLTNKHQYDEQFHIKVADIAKQLPIPPLEGTTDIYSSQQSFLLASPNKWSPRPIFQSYSAYTPKLATLNLQHLEGKQAPDNILFHLESIDHRFPSLDDGSSWPVIINNYSVVKFENDYAYFRKNKEFNTPQQETVYTETHQLNKVVKLPDTNYPVFAKIEIQPTFLGKLLNIFLKPPELYITITLANGQGRQYRTISKMMESEFLVSPLIENTQEFIMLTSPEVLLTDKYVKDIKITTQYGNSIFWKEDYSLKLLKIDFQRNTDLHKLGIN